MLENIIRQQTLSSLSRHLSGQHTVGDESTINFSQDPNKDIFGQDKSKLKSMDSSRYFVCENCRRKIAGGRFAQHVNKCLTRTRN